MLKLDLFFNKFIYKFAEISSIFEAQISEFFLRNKQTHKNYVIQNTKCLRRSY